MGDTRSPQTERASRWPPPWHRYNLPPSVLSPLPPSLPPSPHSLLAHMRYIYCCCPQLEYGDWESVGGGEREGEGEEEREERKSAIAKEALLKFGPMSFTQLALVHDQR